MYFYISRRTRYTLPLIPYNKETQNTSTVQTESGTKHTCGGLDGTQSTSAMEHTTKH